MNGTGVAIALSVASSGAAAQPMFTTSYGIEFSTISDLGNPVVPPEVGPFFYPVGASPLLVGSVNYEYRIARTETTVEQWAEFVTAYRPYYTAGNPNHAPFTGFWIEWSPSQQQYVYNPAMARFPIDPSWRVAASYCNWLHNDKVSEAWAFESGAYDISTFTSNPDGSINDQRQHSPGARFWIPTLDEWTKAMHWDPDRNGPGEGGYWLYPTSSDEPPIPGVPGVGQTNGGIEVGPQYFPVGSYPHVQSPWGLWDGSGGEREWTEYLVEDRFRIVRGSAPGVAPNLADRVDWISLSSPQSSGLGLRLAATIPSSPTLCILALGVLATTRRSRA
jgi:hypothetical protein